MAPRKPVKRSKTVIRRKATSAPPVGRDVLGIALLTIALMTAAAVLSFHLDDPPNGSARDVQNLLGPAGAYLADVVIHYSFGRWISLILPFFLALAGIDLLRGHGLKLIARTFWPLTGAALLAVTIWGLVREFSHLPGALEVNGLVGWALTKVLMNYLGLAGASIILGGLTLIYVTLVLRVRWIELVQAVGGGLAALGSFVTRIPWSNLKRSKRPVVKPAAKVVRKTAPRAAEPKSGGADLTEPKPPKIVTPAHTPRPASAADKASSGTDDEAPSVYHLPSVELLDEPSDDEIIEPDEQMLQEQAQLLEERLAEFGVSAHVVAIHPGPVITRYDLKPAPGVKVSRIASLDDDLALSLSAPALRILAPIPGAGAVGIEVPNPDSRTVRLREIIDSDTFRKATSPLAIALGKTAQGDDFVVDLAKMPHMLIAGTTGSGKSVCINTIIASLLMRNPPQDVMIAMVDPKKLELSTYAELRRHHLLFLEENDEVIATEPKNAVMLLQSVVHEMEKRYDRLAETGVRNIVEFNRMVEKGKVKPDEDGNEPKQLPYLVVIIDELADLMLTAAREVEEPIARLAQMARAVGIHLVVATQRPSVDVLTGVIKANFPARLAFMVASKIDSRTILDRSGAEALLGRGDGLFLAGTSPQPIRFHGALITTEEVHRLITHVHNQPVFIKPLELSLPESSGGGGNGYNGGEDERDQLFEEAVRIVVRHQQGSVSLLQRRLKIGYSRAGRLLDQLEQAGVVGPFEGSKAREVLIEPEDIDTFLGNGAE